MEHTTFVFSAPQSLQMMMFVSNYSTDLNPFKLDHKSFYCKRITRPLDSSGLTYADSRWDPNAQQVLVNHEDGKKETISGPDLGNCCPPPPHQNGNQPTAVDYHQEIHPLANHVHRHQEANLFSRRIVSEEQNIWNINHKNNDQNVSF